MKDTLMRMKGGSNSIYQQRKNISFRVAPRLEGVVRNVGIKPKKKERKVSV